jgi:hypothetical protein
MLNPCKLHSRRHLTPIMQAPKPLGMRLRGHGVTFLRVRVSRQRHAHDIAQLFLDSDKAIMEVLKIKALHGQELRGLEVVISDA